MVFDDFATTRVNVGDAEIAVKIGGAGPPVVLLHGFPQHSLVWRIIAPIMAEQFTVIVPDQRGMGASTLPSVSFTKTDMARDLAAVLDALGHQKISVAGYDLGGGVAVAFARDYPERTERLAVMEFVAAGFGLEQAMAPKPGWNVDSNWHFSVFAAPDVAVWLFAGRERELLNWFFGHEGHGGNGTLDADDLDQYVRALARPGALRAGAQYYAAIFQDGEDNAPIKEQPLAIPMLAIGGASHTGPMLEQLWKPVASQLETAVIPAAGHWLAEENPVATAEALNKFFASASFPNDLIKEHDMSDQDISSAERSSAIPADDPSRSLSVVHPDASDLKHIAVVGDTYTVLLSGADTAGKYALIDMAVPHCGGPGPHRHDFEEMFHLLEGEIEFTFRGEKQLVKAGMTVNIPANAPHFFTNVANVKARMLCMCAPAGQEEFFEAIGTPVASRTAPAPKLSAEEQKAFMMKAEALAPQYRTELLKP